MDVAALSQAAYLEILKRIQGSGYASDDSSNRVKELNAIAKIAEMVSSVVNAASQNLFLSSADEALALLEQVRFLTQDASLTGERRRSRLVAFARGAAKLITARIENAISGYTGSPAGDAVSPVFADAQNHASSPFGGLLYGRLEPAATKQQVRDLAPLLTRGLPARALDGGVATAEAEYGSAVGNSIIVEPDQNYGFQTKTQVAPHQFYPGSILTRELWIEIQSMLCFKSRGFSLDQGEQGRWIFITTSLTATTSSAVDGPAANSGIDWRRRFIQAWGTVTPTNVFDPPPTAAENAWLSASKTGIAADAHSLIGTDGTAIAVTLHADAATGDLVLTNNEAATRHFRLFVRSSPQYTTGTSTDTQPWVDADELGSADVGDIHGAQVISGTTTPGQFGGSIPAGAMRRIVYTGPLSKTVDADHVSGVILDSSEDWRNRWVLVVPITLTGMIYTSANVSAMTSRNGTNSRPRLFNTGSGVAPGSATAQLNQHPDSIASPNVWIYADTTGLLRAEMKSTDSTNASCCMMALVVASELTTAQSIVAEVPAGTTHVQTLDLELPQNCGVYAQGQQGMITPAAAPDTFPRSSVDAKALPLAPTCPPLGLIADGQLPRRPIAWTVRERLGALDDPSFEWRQRIYGQRRRIVSITAPVISTTSVDVFNDVDSIAPGQVDQMDFRDRFVWVEGRFSTTDIRIAAAVASDTSATRFSALFYCGPTDDVTVAINADMNLIFEFERTGGFHSRLVVQNTSGTQYHLNMVIETSGHIGLTDLRAYGLVS